MKKVVNTLSVKKKTPYKYSFVYPESMKKVVNTLSVKKKTPYKYSFVYPESMKKVVNTLSVKKKNSIQIFLCLSRKYEESSEYLIGEEKKLHTNFSRH